MPTGEALDAIKSADVIILGPGSLYTSILPNLVINGMGKAIADSSAFKIYICNIMTQQGETEKYSASEHLKAIIDHTNSDIVDACLVNNVSPSREMLKRYELENSFPVLADSAKIEDMGSLVF